MYSRNARVSKRNRISKGLTIWLFRRIGKVIYPAFYYFSFEAIFHALSDFLPSWNCPLCRSDILLFCSPITQPYCNLFILTLLPATLKWSPPLILFCCIMLGLVKGISGTNQLIWRGERFFFFLNNILLKIIFLFPPLPLSSNISCLLMSFVPPLNRHILTLLLTPYPLKVSNGLPL